MRLSTPSIRFPAIGAVISAGMTCAWVVRAVLVARGGLVRLFCHVAVARKDEWRGLRSPAAACRTAAPAPPGHPDELSRFPCWENAAAAFSKD